MSNGFSFEDLSVDVTVPNVIGSPTPAAKAQPAETKPKPQPVKPKKASSAAGKRRNQIKFYVTDEELKQFSELRGAIPASAFLYAKFQELLK